MAGTYDVQIRSASADRAAKHAVPLRLRDIEVDEGRQGGGWGADR